MRKLLLVGLLLPLAACSRTPAPAPPPEEPAVAECRAEARRSPEIRDAMRRMNSTNAMQEDRVNALRTEAEARAFDQCLRQRGIRRGGGVERVRPPGFF